VEKEVKQMTTIEAMMTKCPECLGAGRCTDDHPNDPYARTWECRECEGAGEIEVEDAP